MTLGIASATETRVVKGQDIPITTAPYQVALLRKAVSDNWAAQFCGGSIVDSRTILTAAHCADGFSAGDLQVLAGSAVLTGAATSRIDIATLTMHPAYNPNTIENDVAVLKTSTVIPINGSTIKAVPLGAGVPAAGSPAFVSGWGSTTYPGPYVYPNQLQGGNVTIQSDGECTSSYGPWYVGGQMLCADNASTGTDSCFGDSGGPLTTNGSQAGVVSWGSGCGQTGYPGVYARVSTYKPWIESLATPDVAPAPAPAPAPVPSPVPDPDPAPVAPPPAPPAMPEEMVCNKGFLQQAKSTATYNKKRRAWRVVSRIRAYKDACFTDRITVIYKRFNRTSRVTQLKGSRVGYRKLYRHRSAPTFDLPELRFYSEGKKNARFVIISWLKRPDVVLQIVRRTPDGLQVNEFDARKGWPVGVWGANS